MINRLQMLGARWQSFYAIESFCISMYVAKPWAILIVLIVCYDFGNYLLISQYFTGNISCIQISISCSSIP